MELGEYRIREQLQELDVEQAQLSWDMTAIELRMRELDHRRAELNLQLFKLETTEPTEPNEINPMDTQ